MAAIYSGVHLKLKSPQTSWEDKLKLARFAWISSQCLLPNKEQVLLDWCTHALTLQHNKKVEFSQEVLDGLWCYLDDVLHSRKLQSALKQGKAITLRLNMAQLLLHCLQECTRVCSKSSVCVSTVLSVCGGVLSSAALSSVFTTKYELIVDLLAKFCLLACQELQQPSPTQSFLSQDDQMSEFLHTDPASPLEISPTDSKPQQTDGDLSSKPKEKSHPTKLFEVLLQVLSCYLSVQRQQANPNRVFALVTNQLIQPLVLLRHLLTLGDWTASGLRLHQQLNRDVRTKIDSVILSALFSSELLPLYKEELLPSKGDSGKRGAGTAKGTIKPVSSTLGKLGAQGYCDPSLHYSVKSTTLPVLFKFFLERFAKARGEPEEELRLLCFYYLSKLVTALDLHLEGGLITLSEKEPTAPQSWSLALLAVESLLSQPLFADVYNIAADRIRHRDVQLNFYRALTKVLLNEPQQSIPSWYRCLKVLVSLNHLIVEPELDQLLSSGWVNADCMEARVLRARQALVCCLLQTYTKLRQMPRLFSELLSVVCQPALDELRPPLLPKGISDAITSCLLDLPPSQGLEICSLVLDSIRNFVLPDLVKEEKTMEINGETGSEKEDASLKLFSLSLLIHTVLFGLRTLDSSSPVPLLRQSQSLMEKMHQLVQDLFHLFTAEKPKHLSSGEHTKAEDLEFQTGVSWEQRTQEAALLLRYTWVEVDILYHMHCSKYTSPSSANGVAGIENQTSPPLTQIDRLLLGEILPARLHPSSPSCSPLSCYLLKLLTLQLMKQVMCDSHSLTEPATASVLNRAAQFVVGRPEFEAGLDGDRRWDKMIGSVNVTSYLVSHLHLVTSNLPLIVPHLSTEDVDCIAHVLVCVLLRKEKERLPDSLTLSSIASDLLQSPVFAEMPSLVSATVQSLTQRIIDVLKAASIVRASPSLLMFQEIKGSQPLSTTQVRKETLVQDLLASSGTGEVSVLLPGTQINELVEILGVVTRLHPDGMSSEDVSSLFILLFFVLASAQPQEKAAVPSDAVGSAMFLTKLLRTLAYLVESRNFLSVFRFMQGSTLLQSAVSSLLWHSDCERLQFTCSTEWSGLIKAFQGFIKSSTQLIIFRNSCVRLNLDQFTSFLISREGSKCSLSSDHLLLASLTSFCEAMISSLGRSKQMDQTLPEMLTRLSASLGPKIESILKPQTVLSSDTVLSQAFIVKVVTVMLHCELSTQPKETEDEQCISLTHMNIYQGVCQQVLKEINSAQRPMDFVVSSLNFLSVFYKAAGMSKRKTEHDKLYTQMLQSMHRLLSASWLSSTDVNELQPAVQELLRHLVEKSTSDEFNMLLLLIKEQLDIIKLRAGNSREVLSAVIIIRLLSCCQLPESCSKALWLIAPQMLSAMVFLVRSSSLDISLTLSFTVPTVTTLTSLLRQGEGLITNPHHVVVVLGALQSVPLENLTPLVYQSTFVAVHEALFAIIQCHPQVMLNAAAPFLNVFHRLVASIMQEGRQRGDLGTGQNSDVYLQCARLLERMYSHIAASAESLTKLSTFMVAQYVTELQKVTLRPDVKLHLTEGIYGILDLCKEQDIKFLMAGLQIGVREVFNELYSSYTHYHKAQRQGEDKYTV
ncbi:unhealthy ribosome biogenesis protein 2 homolog [Gouania willdenowi]|uniref:Nucleolar 27S pre-rRNA processing Urb2/Npa2 C-terminal domain-containing protein n=1 Tax=Gouania willdenowi TaxID=441366 RepID=A0A8C5H144_GOUWI|nr:unhealthy ribosome biogenesis protein 2 homolog [Gouania willdenowi]XP_028290301.1 unhealthy ribosome biogenesis protein 2 homolog [Gouania willdenowi]XP_028290310.1 unhealthy ribosome biogenesis protein 2 homolog [Gouania willdenowi]